MQAVPTFAAVVGFASGFALMGYHEPPVTMLVTSLAIDAALAPLTAVIAARRGRQTVLWAATGFVFGMWALAAVLILGPTRPGRTRPGSPREFPPPHSDAA